MQASDYKAQGNKHLQAKEFDQAIESYSKAIELNPNDHVFYSNRSAAYLSKGNAEEALADAIKVTEIKPDWPKGYSRKGAALHFQKKYEDAVMAYEDGLKIAPDDKGLKDGLDDCAKAMRSGGMGGSGGLFNPQMLAKLASHPKFGPKLADPAFQQKLAMMQSGNMAMLQDPEMMELLQALLGEMGGMPGMDPNAGQPFAPDTSYTPPPQPPKEPEPVLTEEEKAAKDIKDKAIAAKDRGNALYKEKKFDEALAAYDEALTIDPENLLFNSNKAAVYIEMKEIDKAIKICQDAIDSNSRMSFETKAKLLARIGSAYQKNGEFAKCLEYYGKAQMENFDKAVERKMKNLELEIKKKEIEDYKDPVKAQEAKERGNAFFRDNKFGDAVKEYEDAVKRDPDSAPLRNNLAAALVKIMDLNGAKRTIEKAIELDPKYVKAWAKKGDIEFLMKEYHKAMDSYKAGLAVEDGNSLCNEGLRKVMIKINEANSDAPDAERQAHAMADPEIQQILSDMTIRQLLQDFQENPQHANMVMQKDATIRAKIEKLIHAGVLQVK